MKRLLDMIESVASWLLFVVFFVRDFTDSHPWPTFGRSEVPRWN